MVLSLVLFAGNEFKPRLKFGAGALLGPSFSSEAYRRVEQDISFAFLMFNFVPMVTGAL